MRTAAAVALLVVALSAVPAEARAICCGATCCRIADVCWLAGDRNPANGCEECRPTGSGGQLGWTPIADCTAGCSNGVIEAGEQCDDGKPSTSTARTC